MRVSGLLLLTLIVLPSEAAPARHPQQLKSLSPELLENIKVATDSAQPKETRLAWADRYAMTRTFAELTVDKTQNAVGIRRRLYDSLAWRR